MAIEVRDRVLEEQPAVLEPLDFENLDNLRQKIISVIDEHLKSMTIVPRVVYGEPFDFIESLIGERSGRPTGVIFLMGRSKACLRRPGGPSSAIWELRS